MELLFLCRVLNNFKLFNDPERTAYIFISIIFINYIFTTKYGVLHIISSILQSTCRDIEEEKNLRKKKI